MIKNLFSVFDPRSSIFSLSWLIIFVLVLVIPIKMWAVDSSSNKLLKKIISVFKKEVRFSLNKKEKGREAIIILTFLTILSINFLALYPQIFSPTSHLTTTLPLSLSF